MPGENFGKVCENSRAGESIIIIFNDNSPKGAFQYHIKISFPSLSVKNPNW